MIVEYTDHQNELLMAGQLRHLACLPRYRVSHAMVIPLQANLERRRVVDAGEPRGALSRCARMMVRGLKSDEHEASVEHF
jgi:hypothetical protein